MKKADLLILGLILIVQGAMSQSVTGVVTKVPCNNDGIYTITTSGMSTPITYTYYVNGATVVHSNVNSTTDQLTNIGMGGGYLSCNVSNGTSYAWTQSTYTPGFTFSISSTNPVCPATMGTLTATRINGSTGPFTYTWTNKQTLNTYTGNNASVPIGEYSVKITDQNTGCVLEIADSAAAVYQISNITASISTTVASCTNGTASAVASGGMTPYSYSWSNGGSTASISGLSKGYYTLQITDAQGCKSNNLGVYIQQSPNISVYTTVTNATCLQSDGSAIAFGSGGVNPYSYSWGNGQTGNTATNLTGGSYVLVVAKDANGCVGQGYAFVQSSTPITVTYTSTPSSCTSANGSATLSIGGGTAPYSVVWYTNPSATGTTLSNVGPGTYSFKVTDAVGCVRTGTAVVSPASNIYSYMYTSNTVCPNSSGTATINVSGSNPPFTFQWSNSATTQHISGLSAGYYSCVITDAVGCSVTKSGSVKTVSPINVSVSTTPASCKFNKDGTATSHVSGGTPPYTYSYSGGPSTPNASGLGVGDYWLTVTDANSCSTSRHFWIQDGKTTNSCYCTIEGQVFLDANSNCTLDAGEKGIQNIMMHCSGIGYTFTNSNGYYSFQVPTGNYTITQQVQAYYPLASCQSNNISVSVVAAANCLKEVNMANDIATIHDLKIVTINSNAPPIPGYNYQQKVVVKNLGTVTESGVQLGYVRDGQMPLTSSTLSSFTQQNSSGAPKWYSVTSGFPTLAPNASSTMLLNYSTPSNIPLSTGVTFYDTVANAAPISTNWLLDYSPWNNVNTFQTTVVGSFDPNYKEVTPKGDGEEGFISGDVKEFDYTIHFQNEGSYFARNIRITDQLDEDLDWTTFVPGFSENPYTVTISEDGLATFAFENINLPWKSQYGDALSSGSVSYSIRRKTTLPKGTEFTNEANIYFDFNPPITTNMTLNTLEDDVTGVEVKKGVSTGDVVSIDLYPNPANDIFTLKVNNVSKNETATLRIVDLMGKVIMTNKLALQEGSTTITQNVSNLATGTYLTIVQFEDGSRITNKLFLR